MLDLTAFASTVMSLSAHLICGLIKLWKAEMEVVVYLRRVR